MQYNLLSKESKLFINYHIPLSQTDIRNSTAYPILYEFYKELIHARKIINNTPIPSYTISAASVNLYSSIYLPREICKEMKEKLKYKISFTFSIYKQSVLLYFYIDKRPINKTLTLLYDYMNKIRLWLYVLMKYAPSDCQKYVSVSIYVYLTSCRKQLPTFSEDILEPIHVNTAFTTSCPTTKHQQTKPAKIIIYREEEWFKVFIHESFHLFGLDFSGYTSNHLTQCILQLFPVKSEVNAYEAYTEFWAEIIHSIFIAFFITTEKQHFISSAIYLIETEKKYSFYQMTKVLNHMNIKYSDIYSKNRSSKFKENTNVLSYYILKTILLSKWELFIRWCKENNSNILCFSRAAEKQLYFCQYIKKHYQSIYFHKELEEAKRLYQKIKKEKKKQETDFLLNNLRMTICNID